MTRRVAGSGGRLRPRRPWFSRLWGRAMAGPPPRKSLRTDALGAPRGHGDRWVLLAFEEEPNPGESVPRTFQSALHTPTWRRAHHVETLLCSLGRPGRRLREHPDRR